MNVKTGNMILFWVSLETII